MPLTRFFSRLHLTRTLLLALLLALTACESIDGVRTPPRDEAVDVEAYREQIGTLLDEARNAQSPQRDQLYVQAALLLHAIDENDWARNLLGSVDSDMLFDNDYIQYIITYSDIALEDDAYFLAQRILTNQRLEQQLAQQPPVVVEQLRTRRAELFALLGEAAKSVAERVSLNQTLDKEEQKDLNQDALWHTMMLIPAQELRRLSDQEFDPILKGWYALGVISKNNDADLQLQYSSINNWVQSWPDHPASQRLPSDLRLLRQLVEEQPKQVALLLPKSGELQAFGQAVRDGFMAAWYQARQRGTFTPTVRFYDSNVTDINIIYDLAVDQGAELIIGPFDRVDSRKLFDLNTRVELPVPTLALNYVDSPFGYAKNLYQFSFSPEIEAKNIAQRAWLEGHRTAVILVPNTDSGRRTSNAFIEEWETLGGQVVYRTEYDDKAYDFTDTVDLAMLRVESQERYRELRNVLGTTLEFEPRVRQDVDLIFLDANPLKARSIKAAVNKALADRIPIYATRNIYNGAPDPENDRIFTSVRFSTLPWYFDNQSAEKKSIKEVAQPDSRYSFLYALGVDAYKLYPRLKQLQSIPGVSFYGVTGILEMNSENKIEQKHTWARIVDGFAEQLPTVLSETFVDFDNR